MLRDIADETPILNQLLIDSGMIWCFLHLRPEPLSWWLDENPPNVPVKVGLSWSLPRDTIEFRVQERLAMQAKMSDPVSILKDTTF